MKKIVLVLDGVIGKVFLQWVLEKYFSNNIYIVIVKDIALIPSTFPSTFSFYHFDPTSSYRLTQRLEELEGGDFSDVFLLMENLLESSVVFRIVRKFSPTIRIVTLASLASMDERLHNDEHAIFLDSAQIIAGQFISRLPNVPIIPRGFGLGQGEIMEVGVPFGSAFAYRHIGSIQQKNYKIIGVYRNNAFLLSTFSLVIQPQDVVLVAGEPKTLRNIYKQIKSDIGQFPSPFGRDMYLYIDMLIQDANTIYSEIHQALFLHHLIRSTKLFIIVLNPSDFEIIYTIYEMCEGDSSAMVHVDYEDNDFIKRLNQDYKHKIGLIVVGEALFSPKAHRKALFNTATPVLKLARLSLAECKQSVVIMNEEMNTGENLSSVIFDIAIQTNMDICVYDFDQDGIHQEVIIKDYEALGRSFGKKVFITKTTTKNPIFYLRELEEPMLHFLPFERCIAQSKLFALCSTKTERLSLLLDKHPQMLIPIGLH